MPQKSVQRIIDLLASTEVSLTAIAERMGCSRTLVITINQRFQVRKYNGMRTRWLQECDHASAAPEIEDIEQREQPLVKKSA
jgi:hypothetical protein